MIFDTHAHYDDDAFDEDREPLLAQLKAAGIERVVNVGASIHSSHTTLELIEKHDFLYGAIGVHPSETEELNEEWMNWLEEKSHEKKVVAIGEIGLDYHWADSARYCVMVPMPGPISSTQSSLVTPAAAMIFSSTWVSIRKFCPNFFWNTNWYF